MQTLGGLHVAEGKGGVHYFAIMYRIIAIHRENFVGSKFGEFVWKMHLAVLYCTVRICIRYCLVCLQYRAKDCERATKLSMQVFSVDSYIHVL